MKTYKNYLVQDIDTTWTYGVFDTFAKALQFINTLSLPESPVLEIFGTDEDPDTYLTGDTLFVKGESEIIVLDTRKLNIAKRIYKLEKAQDWTDEAFSVIENCKMLDNEEDLLRTIEYLVEELEAERS